MISIDMAVQFLEDGGLCDETDNNAGMTYARECRVLFLIEYSVGMY